MKCFRCNPGNIYYFITHICIGHPSSKSKDKGMFSKHAGKVAQAYTSICQQIVHTPLLEAPLLNQLASQRIGKDIRVLIKCENLQHTGAFKIRGATNRILNLSQEEAMKGVVAFSSGNFAQALAFASNRNDVKCTIIAPHDAPSLKLERTKLYGGEIVLSYPEEGQNREVAASSMAAKFAEEHDACLLHPFDDYEVMYGQGTLALEVYREAERRGDHVDVLVVPAGGGGMLAGCALATIDEGQSINDDSSSKKTRLWSVEPQGHNDHAISFTSEGKQRIPLTGKPVTTKCDALQASAPGNLTWEINSKELSGAVWMSDSAAVEAMKVAFTELKLILEPSGALGIAALLNDRIDDIKDGSVVCVVACGGNIALEDYLKWLQ